MAHSQIDQGRYLILLGDVTDSEGGLIAKLRHEGLARPALDIADHHAGPLLDEAADRGRPDTARAARDYRYLALKSHA